MLSEPLRTYRSIPCSKATQQTASNIAAIAQQSDGEDIRREVQALLVRAKPPRLPGFKAFC